MNQVIYVYLKNEGSDSWRPVQAKKIDEMVYQIDDQNVSDDEEWQFQPNNIVLCRNRIFQNGSGLVAMYSVELIEDTKYKIHLNKNYKKIDYIILERDLPEVGVNIYFYDKNDKCIYDYFQKDMGNAIEFCFKELNIL